MHIPANSLSTGVHELVHILTRFAEAPPETPANGPRTLCYVRAPGRSRPFSPAHPEPRLPPRRCIAAPVSEPDPATIWHRFRTEARARGHRDHLAHLARAADAARARRHDARPRGARRRPLLGRDPLRPPAAARSPRPCSARRARGDRRARGAAEPSSAPRARGPARRPPPQELNPRLHVRPVRDRRLQPARPRRRAGGRRDARAWPTTRCSSAARPGSARPTCCTRSPTTSHEHGAGLTARYTTVEAFTDHFVGAIQGGGLGGVQGAPTAASTCCSSTTSSSCRARPTEQEFFHTFNAVHQAGAQLVLTSDRPPRDLEALEDRLRERFEAGLVCDVRPPERATRLTILRKRVAQDDVGEVDAGRARADRRPRRREHPRARGRADPRRRLRLAHRPAGHRRARRRGARRPLSTAQAAATRSVKEIQEQTGEAFGISMDDLLSSSRAQPVALARQVAMYLRAS